MNLTLLDKTYADPVPRAFRFVRFFALALLMLAVASCSDDDGDSGADSAATESSTTTGPPSTSSGSSTETSEETQPEAAPPADACSLVPAGEVNAATGLSVAEGVAVDSEQRSACAFSAETSGGVGVTVGVEAGGRFAEKADASREGLGVPGEAVAGLGDEALFFFSSELIEEGIGGVLVAEGEITIDVSMQGLLTAEATRAASIAIAEVALRNL
ncbi:hypothetical protein BH18ACT4_BH18ACT4_05330 [soil metagenome]